MYACISPPWFFKYDILFGFLFTLACFLIAGFSYNIYTKIKQKNVLCLSVGFLFMGFAYLSQALINTYFFLNLGKGLCANFQLQHITFLSSLSLTLHLIFMLIGLSFLTYTTLKSREPKILYILLGASVISLLLSRDLFHTFFILSALYFALITWHFVDNYLKNRQPKTLLTALAFFVLTLGWIEFIFINYSPFFYVLGRLLELGAFLLILWNYALVKKR